MVSVCAQSQVEESDPNCVLAYFGWPICEVSTYGVCGLSVPTSEKSDPNCALAYVGWPFCESFIPSVEVSVGSKTCFGFVIEVYGPIKSLVAF